MEHKILVGIMCAFLTLVSVYLLVCLPGLGVKGGRKLFIACNAAVACTGVVASILVFLNLIFYANIFAAVSLLGMMLVTIFLIFFRPRPLLSIPDGKAKAAPGFELVYGDGRTRTLDAAEAYWKAQGCEMAGLKHYYAMAGHLTPEQLKSIRRDCDKSWIITDRLDYRGRMVSVSGGEYVECPKYRHVPLAEVLSTPAGLKLVQALCGTEDGADAIMLKLEKLFGVERGNIWFWTFDMDSRKAYPSRAAGFSYGYGEFHVYGSNLLSDGGRSRGVRVR